MDRPQRGRRLQRSLGAVRGVVRIEPASESRRIALIHELADELPLVAALVGLGYPARGLTVADEIPRKALQ